MTLSLYGEVMGRGKAQVDSSPQVRAVISVSFLAHPDMY